MNAEPARHTSTRFVLLEHDARGASDPATRASGLHWDLLIDLAPDGPLATWRLGGIPTGATRVAAMRLADHRRVYLTYEGPVSEGRGAVRRVDEGSCDVAFDADDAWRLHFDGRLLRGSFRLVSPSGAGALIADAHP